MAPLFCIRQASTHDAAVISALARQIWPVCFKGILTEEQIRNIVDTIYDVRALEHEMTRQKHVFWLAYEGSEPVGYCSAYVMQGEVWIKKLYILPKKQGRGLGRQLIDTARQYFGDASGLALCVHRENISALAFYTRIGFRLSEEVPVKMGDFEFVDFVMRKKAV